MRCLVFIPVLLLAAIGASAEEVSSARARKYAKTLQALVRAGSEEETAKFIDRMGELDHPRSVVLIPPAVTLLPSKANYERAMAVISAIENPKAVEALIKNF